MCRQLPCTKPNQLGGKKDRAQEKVLLLEDNSPDPNSRKTNAIQFAKTVNHYSMTKKLQQLYSHKARNGSPKWGKEAQNLKNQKIVVTNTNPKRPSRPAPNPSP